MRLRFPTRRRGFFRCRRGSTAVEFAIVAVPFLMTMFSTFEVGWFYFANSLVDAAAVNAARIIRTGEAQESALDKDGFFDEVCAKVRTLGDCATRLTVEVRTFPTFAALAADNTPAVCRDALPAAIAAIPYQPGLVSEIVRVRICVLYDTINPALGVNVSESSSGTRRLVATHLFRNEPF
ncbi:MAG: pilus assembly protein [Parvularculaceae bacterium]|jgi:Flp pilus assembly protein TadG|nr:pilus assembly protein [Parvularculaceae bacterium]